MKEQKEETVVQSRRNMVTGSAAMLLGGVAGVAAGRASNAGAAVQPQDTPAPPLPWKWPAGIDPMEAGTRTYQTYLKQKG